MEYPPVFATPAIRQRDILSTTLARLDFRIPVVHSRPNVRPYLVFLAASCCRVASSRAQRDGDWQLAERGGVACGPRNSSAGASQNE